MVPRRAVHVVERMQEDVPMDIAQFKRMAFNKEKIKRERKGKKGKGKRERGQRNSVRMQRGSVGSGKFLERFLCCSEGGFSSRTRRFLA